MSLGLSRGVPSRWEQDYNLQAWHQMSLFDEYLEMVIQVVVRLPFLWGMLPYLLQTIKKVVPGTAGPYSDLHPALQDSSDEEDQTC